MFSAGALTLLAQDGTTEDLLERSSGLVAAPEYGSMDPTLKRPGTSWCGRHIPMEFRQCRPLEQLFWK